MTLSEFILWDQKRLHCNRCIYHVRIKGGPSLTTLFFFFGGGGGGGGVERGSECHLKLAIIGPPAKRHSNGVSLACRLRPTPECWLGSFVILQGLRNNIVKRPYIFVIFQGVRTHCTPCGSPHDTVLSGILLKVVANSPTEQDYELVVCRR